MPNETPLISRIKNREWTRFTGSEFPENLVKIMEEQRVFRSGHGQVYFDTIWFKGELSTKATEWCFVMNDGGNYKVFAEFAFWHTIINCESKPQLVLQCVWSYSHLKKTMRNYLEKGNTLPDPGYQT